MHVVIAKGRVIQRSNPENSTKGKTPRNREDQLLDILDVHTQHLSNFPCSLPQYVLGPNDLI